MFELVVASGKGGTGKTSIVGALAELVRPAVLVDCDVDAANLHLIVTYQVLEEHEFSSSKRAWIDMEKCIACALCLDSCRFEAISMRRDEESRWGMRFDVDPLACEGCGLCARLCEVGAVRFEKVVSGRWFLSESDYGPFLHARLGAAQSNSGRLVSLLRQRAREIGESCGHGMILVDGPPGIGCPVIASLTGASYLLIVTEPSLSAVHDMERLADLAVHFGIKAGVCVNKCDISEEIAGRIEQIAGERGLVIHGRIPYDPAFTEAQLRQQSYLRTASEQGRERIRKIWESIQADAHWHNRADEHRFTA